MFRPNPSAAASALVAALLLLSVPLTAQLPRTGAETVDFERTTSHEELLEFLHEVQSRTDRMRIVPLAETVEGRMMPLVVLGAPPASTPGTAWHSDRPTVFIIGSIHGNETSGKEGALQLIREVALGDRQDLLERVNLLIVPSTNPDGAEARRRTNALGYDMNRDFVALETPEVSGVVEDVLLKWWPDVFVDAHNGGAYPYHLTYQATLHPSADAGLVAFARGPMYQAVKGHMEAQGMKAYWYSGPRYDEEADDWYWRTTAPWLRKQHSYGGFQNVITLLYEVPGRHPFAVRADAHREGYIGLLDFVADQAEGVRRTVREARRRTLEARERVVIDYEERAYPEREEFWVMQEGEAGEREPVLVEGENRTLFVATETRARPWAYAFDGRLVAMAEQLRRHGVEVEEVQAPVTVPAERYHLTDVSWRSTPYQNHHLATVEVRVRPGEVTLEPGAFLVRTAQNAGTLAAYLLEPDTDDSLVTWNFADHLLPRPDPAGEDERSVLPIYRLPQPAGVRTLLPR